MIVRRFPENADITIYPVADVHLGAAEYMANEWQVFCKKVTAEPNSYLVIGGDMVDNAVKTSIASPWENTMRPSDQKKLVAELLRPIKHRILCIIPGNHCARNRDVDDDPMYDVACKLDIEDVYRPNMAFVKIQIGKPRGDGARNPTYMLCVAHGAGSSIYVGGAANRGERFGMAIDGLDCLITGHTHKPGDLPNAKLYIDKHQNKVSVKPWRHLVCSSWIGYAGYAARKLLPPTAYAEQMLILHGKEKATEHSVMCSNYAVDGDEITLLRKLLTEIYPNTSFSAVLDSYDYWNVIDNILPQLKPEILAHNGCMLMRGDSGDCVEVVTKTVFKLWDEFGGSINSKGYKVLNPHVKAIYGDSITIQRCEEIYKILMSNGFACSNVALGVGSFSFQCVEEDGILKPFTRDTFSSCIKATYCEIDGKPTPIFKNPKDGGFKKSQKGCCVVFKDNDGHLTYHDEYTWDEASKENNLLKPVYKDGVLLFERTLSEVRSNLHGGNF